MASEKYQTLTSRDIPIVKAIISLLRGLYMLRDELYNSHDASWTVVSTIFQQILDR